MNTAGAIQGKLCKLYITMHTTVSKHIIQTVLVLSPSFLVLPYIIITIVHFISGFVGVYIAGYILDMTGSWAAVFTETAVVCFTGWIVFMIFGTGKQLV